MWRPHSLRRQLVLGVCAVVTVVLVAVGVVSVLSLRSYVTAMNDAEVVESLHALTHAYARYRSKEDPGPTTIGQAMLGFTGQTPGNLIAVLHDGAVIGCAVFSEDKPQPAPADVVAAIAAQPWYDGPPRTVELASLDSYRVDSVSAPDDPDDRLIVGVSLSLANRTVNRRILTTTVLLVVALVVTAGLTIIVVGYALRPLRRVAATAAAVANMSLADGEERITARVGPEDIDPDNEVGIVGHTLNRLLDNVDGALLHRAESDRRTRQFITDASHELRTPLAAIQGYAELTRQDSAALPETTEYALARIESEAQRMASLVEELLLLSRLGEGQDLHIEDADFADLVLNAVNDAAASAPTHEWISDLPDEPVWVRGDHARLHQLVSNLLNNARVHTPAGTTVKTKLAPVADASYLELTVTDNGPDIDAELVPRLFERFVRADITRSRELGSTGLGLAIVASIVKAHQGTVSAESSGGQTVFRVHLPLATHDGPH